MGDFLCAEYKTFFLLFFVYYYAFVACVRSRNCWRAWWEISIIVVDYYVVINQFFHVNFVMYIIRKNRNFVVLFIGVVVIVSTQTTQKNCSLLTQNKKYKLKQKKFREV